MEELLDFTKQRGLKVREIPDNNAYCAFKDDNRYLHVQKIEGGLYSVRLFGKRIGILNECGVEILTDLYFSDRS